MDGKSLVYGVVSLVIAVLVTVSILVPVVAESTQATDTFTNDGGYYPMTEILSTDEGTYTLSWEKENTTVLTINGVEFDAYESYGYAITTIIASDHWIVRYNSNNNTYGYCQYFDGTTWRGSDTIKSFDLTATEGDVTITIVNSSDVSSDTTDTYEFMYAIMPTSSEDIMKKPTENPYVLGDSQIYAMGVTTLNNAGQLVNISGNIDDGVTVDVLSLSGEEISNIVIDKEEIASHKDLYTINKITFDVKYNDVTTSCTYNFFIVPYEVTAERSIHPDAMTSTIINIIPILVIVGIVLGCVGLIAYRRF